MRLSKVQLGTAGRRSQLSEVLRVESELARITLNSIGDGVICTDVTGNITYLNPVAESMTGWSREEACGRRLPEVLRIIDGDSRETVLDPLAMAIRRNEAVGLSANCVLIRRDGYESAIEDSSAPIHDGSGQLVGAVLVFRDVSGARAMSVRMSYLAQHDFLTGLPNRLLLNDRLLQAIAAAGRHGTCLAVLFVDVDYFKRVNDSLGHTTGDGLLKSIALRLVACVRTTDTVSRHGGDEFIVLLSEVTRTEDAGLSADKILAALSVPYPIEQEDLRITASIGISVFPHDGTDPETLVKNASRALLHAKKKGRGGHAFFELA
jgi:diguanylate cyclase (GGDEF)-like protein/PAS domain S-box-containing protein